MACRGVWTITSDRKATTIQGLFGFDLLVSIDRRIALSRRILLLELLSALTLDNVA